MGDSPDDPRVVDFLQEFVVDREEGTVQPLSHYLRRHGECEEEVARLYLELTTPKQAEEESDARLGRFRLVRELGRGGQGVVYLARDEDLGRDVAIKVLHPGFLGGDEALLRFFREAELVARLDHPGLCPLYERGRADRDYLVFRYVEGASLATRFDAAPNDRDEFAARLDIVEKLARAVHAAHAAGVVHRDLKPSNVILQPDGQPVVLDFGLGRADSKSDMATLTRSGDLFGTPDYMAPEQFDDANAGVGADVWALGCILYQAMVGEPPFRGTTLHGTAIKIKNDEPTSPRRRNKLTPRDAEIVALAALEKDPARRTRTALDLAEDLRRIREHEPITAREPSLATKVLRRMRRRPAETVGVAGVVVILALGAWFQSQRDVLAAARDEALSHMGQLADIELAEELILAERTLWPVSPDLVDACADWDRRLTTLEGHEPEHRALLERLRTHREADGSYRDERERVLDERLSHLFAQLDTLRGLRDGVLARQRRSETIRARSIDDFAAAWDACRARVAANAHYDGLDLAPQLGLVPLGANGHGLEEFWVVETGARPEWDGERGGLPGLGAGVTLVLIPGGETEMGAREGDFAAQKNERPLIAATLAPYFLSKYELTQDQWSRFGGAQESIYSAGHPHLENEPGPPLLHPAEVVGYDEAERLLSHYGLVHPTEFQWEHACRAGSNSAFAYGDDVNESGAWGNFYAREREPHDSTYAGMATYADGHVVHAPVGSYAANAWGLHDLHGNVFEFCRDRYGYFRDATPAAGDGLLAYPDDAERRVVRGGAFTAPAVIGRVARRIPVPADDRQHDLGVRPARALSD